MDGVSYTVDERGNNVIREVMYSTCSFLLGVDFLLFGLISWMSTSPHIIDERHAIYIHKSWVESIDLNLELLYSI